MILSNDITAYKNSKVDPIKSRHDIEALLESKFKISRYAWVRDIPEKAYLLFNFKSEFITDPISYKISIPFIERLPPGMNPKYARDSDYYFDEPRAYRFAYHIIKAMLEMQSIGMKVEQIFRDFQVIDRHADGTPMTLGEKYDIQLMAGKLNAIPALL